MKNTTIEYTDGPIGHVKVVSDFFTLSQGADTQRGASKGHAIT